MIGEVPTREILGNTKQRRISTSAEKLKGPVSKWKVIFAAQYKKFCTRNQQKYNSEAKYNYGWFCCKIFNNIIFGWPSSQTRIRPHVCRAYKTSGDHVSTMRYKKENIWYKQTPEKSCVYDKWSVRWGISIHTGCEHITDWILLSRNSWKDISHDRYSNPNRW